MYTDHPENFLCQAVNHILCCTAFTVPEGTVKPIGTAFRCYAASEEVEEAEPKEGGSETEQKNGETGEGGNGSTKSKLHRPANGRKQRIQNKMPLQQEKPSFPIPTLPDLEKVVPNYGSGQDGSERGKINS